MPSITITPGFSRREIAVFGTLLLGLAASSYHLGKYTAPTPPKSLTSITSSIELEQMRLEARLTGLMKYCIKDNTVQRFKPGCEELAQYVTQQANSALMTERASQ